MPTLTVTKTYINGNTLSESDLDGIKSSIETFFNTTKIDGANIQDGGIALAKLTTNSVDETKLTTSVAGSGLSGGGGSPLAVQVDGTSITINSNILQVSSIAGITGITGSQLANGTITTTQIASNTIAKANLAIQNYTLPSSTGTSSTSSTSYVDIQNQSASFGTTGRPFVVCLQPDGVTGASQISLTTVGGVASATINFLISGSSYESIITSAVATGTIGVPPASVNLWVQLPAGTYTITARMKVSTGSATFSVVNCKMVIYEPF